MRKMVQQFRGKQATCKCKGSILQENNPNASCTHVVLVLVCTKEKHRTAFHSTTGWLYMLALANSVC